MVTIFTGLIHVVLVAAASLCQLLLIGVVIA